MYSQQPLIDLLKKGLISEENKTPKHIETVISNVFVFDTRVYKLYKNDSDFFNTNFRNLEPKEDRFLFTQRDFSWNHALSPMVYTKLIGVRYMDEKLELLSPEDTACDELIIVMNKLETKDILFEKLMRGEISLADCYSIGRQLADSLTHAQKKLDGRHNFFLNFEIRISDLRNWISSVKDYIPEKEANAYCDYLNDFRIKNQPLFESELTNEIVHGGDIHSHNAVFSNGILYIMDAFPPKEEWVVDHRLIPLYRMGVDIWALSGNKEFFEEFIRGYEEIDGRKVNRKLDTVYVTYAATIMVSYLYMLQETDPEKKDAAQRFHKFLREYYETVR